MDHVTPSELVPGCSMCLRKAVPPFERLVRDAWTLLASHQPHSGLLQHAVLLCNSSVV